MMPIERLALCPVLCGALLVSACVAPRDFNQLMPKSPAYSQVDAQLHTEAASERAQLEQLQNLVKLTLANALLFPEGGAQLNPTGQAALNTLAPALRGLKGQRIVVKGFTDDVPLGHSQRERLGGNVELSKARAEAVAGLLTAQGVPAVLITTVGLGESHPRASNETPAGRALNRRVEVDIIEAPA